MKVSHGDRQPLHVFSDSEKTNSNSSSNKNTSSETKQDTSPQLRRDGDVDTLRNRPGALMDKAMQVADLVDQMRGLHGMEMPERSGLDVPDIGAPPDGKPNQGKGGGNGEKSPIDQLLDGTPGGGFGNDGMTVEAFEEMLLGNRGQLGAAYDNAFNKALNDAGIPTELGAAFGLGSGAADDAAEQSILGQLQDRATGGNDAPAGKPNPMNFNSSAEFRMGYTSQEAEGDNAANGAGANDGSNSGDDSGSTTGNVLTQVAGAAVNAVTGAAKGVAGAVGNLISAAMTILTANTNNAQTKGDEAIGYGVFGKWGKGEEVSMGSIKDPRQGGNGTTERTTGEDDGPKYISADMVRQFESKKEGLVNRLEPDEHDNADAAAKIAQGAALKIASVINIDPDSDQPQTDGEIKLPDNPLVDPPEPDTPGGLDVDVPDVHPGQIGPNVGGGRGPRGGLTM